jgi:hypothetical protein
MTAFQRRLFILFDEWIGAVLVLYLWRTGDKLFLPVFIFWGIAIYGISYPLHWYYQYRERKPVDPDKRFFETMKRIGS